MDYEQDQGQGYGEMNKIKDIEEKQKIAKERLLMIGENLIEIKERSDKKFLEFKKEIEDLKNKMEKITSFIEAISSEFNKFAKKDDLEIIAKQMRLFQPFIKHQKS